MFAFTKMYLLASLISGFIMLQSFFNGGLKFHGNEQAISQRTSYTIFGEHDAEFSDHFDIAFSLSLSSVEEIGYILRIKTGVNNRIFNLFYDSQGDHIVFKFNEEGKTNLIVANMDKDQLFDQQWFDMKLSFDLIGDSITLTIDNKPFTTNNQHLQDTYHPDILFGKSDHIIDVPAFSIKNLSILGKETYHFPLYENEGSIVHDINGNAYGNVINPDWLKNYAYYWKHLASFKSATVAGANYDPNKEEIYYYNQDSLWSYNVRSGITRTVVFDQKCPVELILGTNFIDSVQNKLYTYEVYYDFPYQGPTVASLDLDTYQWTEESYQQLPTQLHHHGSSIDHSSSQYSIFGGFGNMKYSKNFFSFDLKNKEWKLTEGFTGDVITPRYFSSVGYQAENNNLHILGGMGNESGDQSVGRKYYYDLYQVDMDTKHVTKRWEIPWENDNVVPVRGMVILNDSSLYTLCYPEHFSESFLHLYRFSLTDGSYEILGDSIPIRSDKITTNANLYVDKGLNNLYAVVQEFEDDISSDLKIYSLAFPAITRAELSDFPAKRHSNTPLLILLLGVGAIALGLFLYKKLKSTSPEAAKNPEEEAVEKIHVPTTAHTVPTNSIHLFGNFMVRDTKGRDITYMFSTQLKQVFCLILHYSLSEDGITSQHLSNLLWPDKPADKVKNSRGVTINNLRKTLGELNGIELVHEKGHYKIILHEEAYCDYARCLQLIAAHKMDELRDEFAGIVSRGKFLYLLDDPLFDLFKEEAETKLEPALILEMEKSFTSESYTTTISLAEALFNIDPLNETALVHQVKAMLKLNMIEDSKLAYRTFAIEYKHATGKDFHRSYQSIIS
ncbi:DNA-binding transcriptional activator [Echinicola strongylocentroti]|uniref:DNA-binding transcriptional activator n=1 Tax=Echinicola strongylocentroti TaxID=1795355 RepID=A0A2Z4IGM9_9BACT|nr:kelch repeat-containing protein [Echinicola strongylocentroti]AWW30262.1 DNA-binding transcriptional activator [Echinicola strongylocentroti]